MGLATVPNALGTHVLDVCGEAEEEVRTACTEDSPRADDWRQGAVDDQLGVSGRELKHCLASEARSVSVLGSDSRPRLPTLRDLSVQKWKAAAAPTMVGI